MKIELKNLGVEFAKLQSKPDSIPLPELFWEDWTKSSFSQFP